MKIKFQNILTLPILLLLMLTPHLKAFADNQDLKQILPTILPSVVNIASQGRVPWYHKQSEDLNMPSRRPSPYFQHLGSGVIINADKGLIITNAHVISGADTIIITLNDGRHVEANLIGSDPITDLALLHIHANHLHAIDLGHTPVMVGQAVIAIGNPFGLAQTVTSGIVSGLHRHIGLEGIENFIQTDAPINPGNSGGALVNPQGELVGINTAILSPGGRGNIGIGFAIPLEIFKPIIQQLINNHDVKRGLLGVIAQNLEPNLADALHLPNQKGALISEVIPNSTAYKLGIKVRDVIVRINNQKISDAIEIKAHVGVTRLNSPISVTLLRNKHLIHLKGKLLKHPDTHSDHKKSRVDGMVLKTIDAISPINKRVQGAVIDMIERGSGPWLSGLAVDDIVISVNGIKINNIADFIKAVNQRGAEKTILLKVLRENRSLYIALR